jgi:putative membrane protein
MIGFDHFGMGLGGLGMLLFWAVFIIAIALLLRLIGDRNGRKKSAALDILDERYARGEIDREEYLKRRADLESSC